MTAPDALSAIAGIQQNLATLRSGGTTAPAASSSSAATPSADVFAALLARLTGSSSSAQDQFGQQLVDDARDYLGTPYVLGGTTKSGIDCSGLVKEVLAKHGVDAPHDSSLQGQMGTEIPSLAEAKPGDLIVFNNGHHIGVYAGDNKVIHAPSPGKQVVEQELWTDQPYSIRRIAAPEASTSTPAVDLSSVLSGLSLLGTLAQSLGQNGTPGLGTSGLGASALGAGLLGTSSTGSFDSSMLLSSYLSSVLTGSGDTSDASSSGDLTTLTLQRMALLQKGSA